MYLHNISSDIRDVSSNRKGGNDLRVSLFEKSLLCRVLGCKRDEVTGCWRKLRTEGLHNMYCSPCVRELRNVSFNDAVIC